MFKNINRNLRAAGIALLLLILPCMAAAQLHDEGQASDRLVVALDRAWQPFSYLDSQGRPQGLMIDYWRRVAQKMGRSVEFKLVDWQESLDLVRAGNADLHGGLFESEQRATYLAFSSNLIDLSTRLFVSSRLNARGFEDLKNVQVGITRGGYESEFVSDNFPDISLKHYSNNQELVQSALAGEVLAFVADYPVGMHYLHKYGSPEQYRVVSTLYTKPLKSAVQKGQVSLLAEINDGLKKMSREETNAVTQKWMLTETEAPPWLFTALLGLVGTVILVGGLIYTILLRIQVRHRTRELQAEVEQSRKLRTANVELMAELRRQKDEAEQANRAKSKFLAAASHDLRQPLHALALFTSVLGDTIKYPEVRKVVDQIQSSVFSLQNLFDALLDISKLDAGEQVVEKCALPLNPLFAKLANDFNPQAEKEGLQISWPECWAHVLSDPYLLEQILRNLISNAIRYTEAGEIRVTCDPVDHEVCIGVTDTGVGIPSDELDHIFEEFHQLNNPERDRTKGLGLGLAIVRRAARLLDHRIDVASVEHSGSQFSVYLEKARHHTVSTGAPVESPPSSQTPYNLNFIVIEDEPSLQAGMQARLKLWGCGSVVAEDLEEALDQLKDGTETVDGIIADYRLRGNLIGADVVAALQARFNDSVPVLIVTGDVAPESLRDITDRGFQYVQKPVPPAKLHAFVRNVFNRKRSASVQKID